MQQKFGNRLVEDCHWKDPNGGLGTTRCLVLFKAGFEEAREILGVAECTQELILVQLDEICNKNREVLFLRKNCEMEMVGAGLLNYVIEKHVITT